MIFFQTGILWKKTKQCPINYESRMNRYNLHCNTPFASEYNCTLESPELYLIDDWHLGVDRKKQIFTDYI